MSASPEGAGQEAAPKRSRRRRSRRGRGRAKAARRMLMNVVDPEEIRVAIVGPDGLEELYIERIGSGYVHGNIYKGKIENVEPTLQAAFVDIGGAKNGFLHVTDVVPPHGGYADVLKKPRRRQAKGGQRQAIESMLQKGQEVLVQITREQHSNKGPSLTTYLSLPGRYLVMMPAVAKRGVSRKITDDKERRELKAALDRLNPPKEFGFIIRTAGTSGGEESLKTDLDYLMHLYNAVMQRAKQVQAPAAIYQESDLVIRSIRDYLYEDIDELLIDSEPEWKRACEFLRIVMPNFVPRAKVHTASTPLFDQYAVDKEIEKICARSVRLPSGGEIVIEQTEAMVTIDVNTGRFRKGDSSRDTILAINLEAAKEIARQLRLRDLGGLIMLDFVDMDGAADRKQVEDAMRQAMAKDRARKTLLPISSLGVMEMTRQRMRRSLEGSLFTVCTACGGSELQKAPDVLALEFVRRLRAFLEGRSGTVLARMHPDTAMNVSNLKRAAIATLETDMGSHVRMIPDRSLPLDDIQLSWEEAPAH